MKRVLLGLSLACLSLGTAGCCCWQGSGWSPCAWPGCGAGGGCGGGCGDTCGGWGGWNGWGCGRPGGCGEIYWGDWCTGDPHCSTCDRSAPTGLVRHRPVAMVSAPILTHALIRTATRWCAALRTRRPSQMQMQSQMAHRAPPAEYAPQMVSRGVRSSNGLPPRARSAVRSARAGAGIRRRYAVPGHD